MNSIVPDQPAPSNNKRRPTWDYVQERFAAWSEDTALPGGAHRVVMDEMITRDRLGRQRYGTPLQPFNGRRAVVDAAQEALDLCAYLGQLCQETEISDSSTYRAYRAQLDAAFGLAVFLLGKV